jgi:membrane-associated phospholipid phosphatase
MEILEEPENGDLPTLCLRGRITIRRRINVGIKTRLEKLVLRGVNFKYWKENIVLCLVTMLFSSSMVIINKLELPGEIHRLETRWDLAIPVIVPFVLAYILYFPFVYLGWAYIFAMWPKYFRPYAIAMMVIGLITGIINIAYPTYAPRAVVDNTDIFAKMLIYLYNLNRPLTALPSLHVAHSLCTGYFLSKIHPKKTWLWMSTVVLISISTLFVKHHYIADVVVGGFLGAIVILAIDLIWEGRAMSRLLVEEY